MGGDFSKQVDDLKTLKPGLQTTPRTFPRRPVNKDKSGHTGSDGNLRSGLKKATLHFN